MGDTVLITEVEISRLVFCDADLLLAAAKFILHPSNALVDCSGCDCNQTNHAMLAIKLYRRKDMLFRSLVEGWNRERIVKELY